MNVRLFSMPGSHAAMTGQLLFAHKGISYMRTDLLASPRMWPTCRSPRSLRLAMSLDDLRPAIGDRPAGRLASRIVTHFPGRTPAVLPPEWLEPITAPAG